ncbi:hypothetical protein SAMN05192588_1479 [Nonlabens sp. Hel1_33_55]|uniref:hypothetical protein n=1 Tax=Nonlabens sp. Hel1_33_55 TaxID=1336802 RepID=UPI000875BB15|nr:hypothetical protein [Nonlabens sp. Hel1_33_55]SCY16883.1 hypothetical protein SAMN05192588_1479 [Nonlabens sp. Hel1_33_55]
MKTFLFVSIIALLVVGCNNIQSVTYQEPTKLRKNEFIVRKGSYTIVKPEVPVRLVNETFSRLEENMRDLLGNCLLSNSVVKATDIQIDDYKIRKADINSIKILQPNVDFVIHISSTYKEPIVTQFRDTRKSFSPDEHVTGTLTIFDISTNRIIYQQQLIGSTEEKYDVFNDDNDLILFKATGNMLTEKVLKRLIDGVSRHAENFVDSCNK